MNDESRDDGRPPESEAAGDGRRGPAGDVPPEARRTPLTQQVGRVVLIAAAVLFVVFAVVNWQSVEFNWVFGSSEITPAPGGGTTGGVPLIVLLVGAFVLGAIVGRLSSWRRHRRRDETD